MSAYLIIYKIKYAFLNASSHKNSDNIHHRNTDLVKARKAS